MTEIIFSRFDVIIIVVPCLFKDSKRKKTFLTVVLSRKFSGWSAIIISGLLISALAITTFCFSPFDSLVNFYNDDRKNLLYTFFGVPYLRKYSNTSMNITILRLAEILLTRAECKVHLNY